MTEDQERTLREMLLILELQPLYGYPTDTQTEEIVTYVRHLTELHSQASLHASGLL